MGFIPPTTTVTINTTRYNATPTSSESNSLDATLLGYPVGDVMHDVVTPGYRTLSRKGRIVNNPMSRIHAEVSLVPWSGQWLHRNRKTSTTVTGTELTADVYYSNRVAPLSHANYPAISHVDAAALRQQAINEAFEKAHQRNVMGAVDIAESGKTAEMLRTQLGRIDRVRDESLFVDKKKSFTKSGKRYLRYVPKTAGGRAADIAGLWLELQYGIIPLMLSIDGLMEALDKDVNSGDSAIDQTYRGFESRSDFINKTNTTFSTGQLGTANAYKVDYIHILDYTCEARAGLRTRYKPSLRARLGLEGRDLVPAAYELIPYSFVVDWFFDLGTAIEAMTPVKGFHSNASWVKTDLEEYETFAIKHYASSEETTNIIGYTNEMYVETTVIRRSAFRTPGVVPGLPNLDLHFKSFTHLISGLALVISNSKSKAISRI